MGKIELPPVSGVRLVLAFDPGLFENQVNEAIGSYCQQQFVVEDVKFSTVAFEGVIYHHALLIIRKRVV